MKKLKNNTKNDLSVTYKGKVYDLPAKFEKNFQDEVAEWWKNIHKFLILEDVPEGRKAALGVENPNVVAPEPEDSDEETVEEEKLDEPEEEKDEDEVAEEKEPIVFVPTGESDDVDK